MLVYAVIRLTYFNGFTVSYLIASVYTNTVYSFSSHRSPMEKKNPIRKIGTPPKIVKTIWATAVASVPDEVKIEMVTQPRPRPNTNNPIPMRAIMTGRAVMLFVTNERLVPRSREIIRILANFSRTRALISSEPQRYPRLPWFLSVSGTHLPAQTLEGQPFLAIPVQCLRPEHARSGEWLDDHKSPRQFPICEC